MSGVNLRFYFIFYGSEGRHRSIILVATSRYILTGDADLSWMFAELVAFLGRTEHGVWRLACITHASYCLYSMVVPGKGGEGGGAGAI